MNQTIILTPNALAALEASPPHSRGVLRTMVTDFLKLLPSPGDEPLRESAVEDAVKKALRSLFMRNICAALRSCPGAGGRWEQTPESPDSPVHFGSKLRRPGYPGELFFDFDFYHFRVECRGSYPRTTKGNEDCRDYADQGNSPSATFAFGRPPEDLARDIKRKVIPEFVRIAAKAEENRLSREAHEARKQALIVELATILAAPLPQHGGEELYLRQTGLSGSVRVCSGESVYFKIDHTNADTARKIATFLLTLIPNDESSDLRTVSARESEQREPQVRCDDWLGDTNL